MENHIVVGERLSLTDRGRWHAYSLQDRLLALKYESEYL
jgi:hypothetical protein